MFYLLFCLMACYAFDDKMLMAQYALSNFKEDYPIFGPKSNFYFGSNKLDIKFSFKRFSTNNATMLYIDNKISKMSILTKNSLHEYDDITNTTTENKISQIYCFNSTKEFSISTNNQVYYNNKTGVYEFYPNCFKDDNVTHSLKISFVLDYGTMLKLGSYKNVIYELENQVALMRLIYMSQIRTRIDVDNVVVGSKNSPVPLSRNENDGTCKGVLGVDRELAIWTNEKAPKSNLWMLLSYCFKGIVGVSYIGNYCGSKTSNVAYFDWLIMSHELGHSIGAQHTFQNGVGTTGGIMDYGSGAYNDVLQFHPVNKPQICGFLNYLKTSSDTCFVKSTNLCSDGILTPDEECECINRKKNCGSKSARCVNCKLTRKNVECSSQYFTVKPYTSVRDKNALSSSKCCRNYKNIC